MQVFGYSDEGFYSGPVHCQPNPKRPGQFLMPSRSTMLEPPTSVTEGKRLKFSEELNQWVEVDDESFLFAQEKIVNTSYNEYGVLTKEIVNGKAKDRKPEKIQADTTKVQWSRLRSLRDAKIRNSRWLQERHKDELELGAPTTLTGLQYEELLSYWQLLRSLPKDTVDPANPVWPTDPVFLLEE